MRVSSNAQYSFDRHGADWGTSKANRLRCFLQTADRGKVVRALSALWEYREAVRQREGREEKLVDPHGRLFGVIGRLSPGGAGDPRAEASPAPTFAREMYPQLLAELLRLSALPPQAGGYAFESFLKTLFGKFQLEVRDPFPLRGEQIDGSFVLGNEIYLLEGKWQNVPSGVDHLHTFHGKVEQKAA
jgi:hypothetical protein